MRRSSAGSGYRWQWVTPLPASKVALDRASLRAAKRRLCWEELFEAAKVLLTSESLEKILGLVLFVGNYLHLGGEQRSHVRAFTRVHALRAMDLHGEEMEEENGDLKIMICDHV